VICRTTISARWLLIDLARTARQRGACCEHAPPIQPLQWTATVSGPDDLIHAGAEIVLAIRRGGAASTVVMRRWLKPSCRAFHGSNEPMMLGLPSARMDSGRLGVTRLDSFCNAPL